MTDADILLGRLTAFLDRLERGEPLVAQQWFSIAQAASLTGLSPDHIRRAVTGGTLPCSNVGTMDRPTYRISRVDIDAWMERRKAGALPPLRKKKGVAPEQVPYSPHRRK